MARIKVGFYAQGVTLCNSIQARKAEPAPGAIALELLRRTTIHKASVVPAELAWSGAGCHELSMPTVTNCQK